MDAINTNMAERTYPFSVRVYGIVCHHGKVLISEEFWFNTHMIKFPGGGLEFGEGILDALKREFVEELDAEIIFAEPFFVPDFFIPTQFYKNIQVIPIYYLVKVAEPNNIIIKELPMNKDELIEGAQHFHWMDCNENLTTLLTFPGDKAAWQKFLEKSNVLKP